MESITSTLCRLLGGADPPLSHLTPHLAGPADLDRICHGEVRKPETLNYRTFRPEPDGLFCEKIFGEVGVGPADREGFAEAMRAAFELLPKDPGAPMAPRQRWSRFGQVTLAEPVVHPWLRAVAAADEPASGALLTAIPVLPAELRPLMPLEGGRFATSDLNDLYRRLVNRNNRLRRLVELDAPQVIIDNEIRMLHQAVDCLFQNGRGEVPAITNPGGEPLKSLSDLLDRTIAPDERWGALVELDALVGQQGPEALEGELPARLFRLVRYLRAMSIELAPGAAAGEADAAQGSGGLAAVPY